MQLAKAQSHHVRLCSLKFLYEDLYLLEDLQRMNEPSRVKGVVQPAGAAKKSDAITPLRAIANPNCLPKTMQDTSEVVRSGRRRAEQQQRAKNYQLLVYGWNDHEAWLE